MTQALLIPAADQEVIDVLGHRVGFVARSQTVELTEGMGKTPFDGQGEAPKLRRHD